MSDQQYSIVINNTTGNPIGYNVDAVSQQVCSTWVNSDPGSGTSQTITVDGGFAPTAGQVSCIAFWNNPGQEPADAPPDAVYTWTPRQEDTGINITFDGSTVTLNNTYCLNSSPAANKTNSLDYFFSNQDTSDGVSICFGKENADCGSFTLANNPCGDNILTLDTCEEGDCPSGSLSFQAQADEGICFAFWKSSAGQNDNPDGVESIQTVGFGTTGGYYTWDGTNITQINEFTTCSTRNQSCQSNSQCGPGQICTNGQCVRGQGCQQNSDCTQQGTVCQNGQCIPGTPCQTDSDCTGGDVCTNNICTPNGGGNGGESFWRRYWWAILIGIIVLILIIWLIIHSSRKSSSSDESS